MKSTQRVENGDESALRATIRGLMTGPQFHEFLIRASNDRLLTDRDWTVIDNAASHHFVDASNLYHQKAVAVAEGRLDKGEFQTWQNRVQFGFRRAPLELIAYVAENDLPYTEILTADYIMANPMAVEAYGASTVFTDPNDPFEFRPSEIVSYYRDDESKVSEYSLEFGTKVTDPGNLWTIYPHAGILNTTVFLKRYPTTATNRNRARARWTYYHFLGLDVEKSASRTHRPGGTGRYQQSNHAQPGLHGVPQRPRSGGRGVPELRRWGFLQRPVGWHGLLGSFLQACATRRSGRYHRRALLERPTYLFCLGMAPGRRERCRIAGDSPAQPRSFTPRYRFSRHPAFGREFGGTL